MSDAKRMKLRYAGTCSICGMQLPARVEAIYEPTTKSVHCIGCPIDTNLASRGGSGEFVGHSDRTLGAGVAGSSARREYERRRAMDEENLRKKWGMFGGIAVALSDERQTTRAWATGAAGEELLGARLNSISSDSVALLHDLRIPGSRANIDHMAVSRSGVWVIDAKHYRGRPQLRIEGGILRPRVERVLVGRRDCTRLVDGVLKQVTVVSEVVPEVLVRGVLCFVEADWPLVGGDFTTRGVSVLWPKRLVKLIGNAEGSVDVAVVCQRLASHFRAA